MRNMRKIRQLIIPAALLCLGCVSQVPADNNGPRLRGEQYGYLPGGVWLMKVRDCEYIMVHTNIGSSVTHAADCRNPTHRSESCDN